MYKVASR